jgi:hypothetical protein
MTKHKTDSLERDVRAYVRWMKRQGRKLVEIDRQVCAHWPHINPNWLRRFVRQVLSEVRP